MKLHQPRAIRDQAPPGADPEPSEAEIQKVAYYLWQEKGCPEGHDLDHWLEARESLRHHVPRHAENRPGFRSQAPNVVHFPTAHSNAPFQPSGPEHENAHLDFRHSTPPSQPSNLPLRKS